MDYLKTPNRTFRHIFVLPFIYPAFFLILMLDIWIEIYHRISFPLYRYPYVRRKEYIRIDRHKLSYLNPVQKMNCVYCGYANGVLQYFVKIVGETERYWCGIKHNTEKTFHSPPHHEGFIEYNNREQYIEDFESKKTRGLG